jgi:hypothetical protein
MALIHLIALTALCGGPQNAARWSATFDRSYYTSETTAWVHVEPYAGSARLRLSALLQHRGGTIRAASAANMPGARLALPLARVPIGEWEVRLEGRSSTNTLVWTQVLTLRKLPPAPPGVAEVKLDHVRGCLLKDGKPFFPVGICALQLDPDWVRLYRDCGFNTLILWQGEGQNRPVSAGLRQLDLLRQHGLWAVPRPLTWASGGLAMRDSSEALLRACDELRRKMDPVWTHPAVLAYYTVDEPGDDPKYTPGLEGFRNLVREKAPYHPVWLGDGSTSADTRQTVADVPLRFAYWCPMGAAPFHTPAIISRCVQWNVANIAVPQRRPFLLMPQCEITSFSRRPLTPEERRISVYLGIVNGAKGILYFATPIRHRATVQSLTQLSKELAALAPALLNRPVPQRIAVSPAPAATLGQPLDFEKPERDGNDVPIVQALFADRPEGGSLLIAANSSWKPVEVAWNLSSLGPGLRVRDFFTGKSLQVANGTLRDALPRYGTRVYLISGAKRAAGAPVQLSARLQGPALAVAGKAEPLPEWRPRKNLLINSSFEEAALPGWPDSWWLEGGDPLPMIGDPDGPGQDPTTAVHGRYSLRHTSITYRHEFPNTWLRGGVPVTPGQSYVLSVYLRADRPGRKARLSLVNFARNSAIEEEGAVSVVELDTQWRRYELTLTYPANGFPTEALRPDLEVSIRGGPGVWIDAVQLEEGTRATEYAP